MTMGFKDRFVLKVRRGWKRHSIRKGNRWRVGMRVDAYEKPRQKGMNLILRAPVTKVQHIEIVGLYFAGIRLSGLKVTIDGHTLDAAEMHQFFRADGFNDGTEGAIKFWAKDLHEGDFIGQVVHWNWNRREFWKARRRPRRHYRRKKK